MTPVRWITAIGLGMVTASVAIADITNITQGTMHPTIQDAIDLAHDHDEIVLDPGEYTEYFIQLRGKPLTLRSQDPTDPVTVAQTVLTGDYQTVFYCHEGEGPDTVISGFVFPSASEPYGAIYISDASPTISRCAFQANFSLDYAAAIYLDNSSSLIIDCGFRENVTYDGSGGGAICIRSSTPRLRNCVFDRNERYNSHGGAINVRFSTVLMESCLLRHNKATHGAAIASWSSEVTLADCRFVGNEATYGYGSAVSLIEGSTLTADGCEFIENNSAGSGAAIHCIGGSHAAFTDCRIEGNVSGGSGGGIYLDVDGVDTCSLQDSMVCANDPDQIHGTPNDLGGNVIADIIVPPASIVEPCAEDINGDGVVDLADLGALLALFDQPCP